jgi:hypothetical protein
MAKATGTGTLILVLSKLHRSRSTGALVPQRRLPERRGKPVTLDAASASCGKAIQVEGWLETCDFPGDWVFLAEDGDDLLLFPTCFVAAFEIRFPGSAAEVRPLLNSGRLPARKLVTHRLISAMNRIESLLVLIRADRDQLWNAAILYLTDGRMPRPPRLTPRVSKFS